MRTFNVSELISEYWKTYGTGLLYMVIILKELLDLDDAWDKTGCTCSDIVINNSRQALVELFVF